MAAEPSQNEIDLQAQISSALARRSQRQPSGGADPRIEPTLGLGGMGPGSERAAPRRDSLQDDEPVGEIPPAPVHFQRDGEDHHPPRPKPKVDSRLEKHRNWLMFLLPVVGVPVVILISLFLYLAIEMHGKGVQDSAPLVEAPEGPEKVKPTNEGGLQVQGMDSAMLNQTDKSQTTTEQLLPPPEEPMTPPPPAAATAGDGTAASDGTAAPAAPSVEVPLTSSSTESATSTAPAATASTTTAPATSSTGSSAAVDVPSVPAPSTVPSGSSTSSSTSSTGSTASTAQPVTEQPVQAELPKPLTTQTATAGSYRIQLVALQSQDAATAAWTAMQKKYPDLLGNLSATIMKIDLGAQGVFYRVQGGPLPDRQAAEKLCGKLDQRGQACLVVRP